MFFIVAWLTITTRAATVNFSQTRPNILPQFFLTGCFLQDRIETQNLGKAQDLGAFSAVAALLASLLPFISSDNVYYAKPLTSD